MCNFCWVSSNGDDFFGRNRCCGGGVIVCCLFGVEFSCLFCGLFKVIDGIGSIGGNRVLVDFFIDKMLYINFVVSG